MSTATATTARARYAGPRTQSPDRSTPLSLVAARPRVAPRGPFVALLLGLLAAGLLGLLLLNTVVAQQSFHVHELQRSAAQLALQEQALQQEVAVLESPQSLAHRARLLGMVPAGDPVFLRLSDGAVLGNPVPAAAAEPAPRAAPETAATAAGASPTTAATSPAPAQ